MRDDDILDVDDVCALGCWYLDVDGSAYTYTIINIGPMTAITYPVAFSCEQFGATTTVVTDLLGQGHTNGRLDTPQGVW